MARRTGRWRHRALRAKPAATNCALLVGHTTLRVATLDDLGQPATGEAQITRMRELVREAMEAGAIGVSTGLFYEPSVAAPCRGSDRNLPPVEGVRRRLLHPHARRSGPRDGTRWRKHSGSAARSVCRW